MNKLVIADGVGGENIKYRAEFSEGVLVLTFKESEVRKLEDCEVDCFDGEFGEFHDYEAGEFGFAFQDGPMLRTKTIEEKGLLELQEQIDLILWEMLPVFTAVESEQDKQERIRRQRLFTKFVCTCAECGATARGGTYPFMLLSDAEMKSADKYGRIETICHDCF